MTANNRPSVLQVARSDPLGAGILVSVIALATLGIVALLPRDGETPWLRWPDIPELLGLPRRAPRPLAPPPAAWLASARPGDVLRVPSVPVAYWGRPDAVYGIGPTARATRPIAIVMHHTDETPVLRLVRYGHAPDMSRGGASYGYHIYIDPQGRVMQGAPLSVRTNHIKPAGHPARRLAAAHLDGASTIGIALVGACKSPPLSPITYRCERETITQAQEAATRAVIQALRMRFGIACAAIYGHGELQTDRKPFEGKAISARARASCP